MSFRLRIVLMTTVLFAILFSVGGAIFVHTSFQASLQKEELAAMENNELILKIAKFVSENDAEFSEKDFHSAIQNICSQGTVDALHVICGDENIYQYQNKENILPCMNQVSAASENQVLISYFETNTGEMYVQATTRFLVNEKSYYLHTGRNLLNVYEVRAEQIKVFQYIFCVLCIVGVFLSWALATFLTRHLRRLTKASREIGAGNLACRAQIRSDDEIGMLAKSFDEMVEKLESNIELLKESVEQKDRFVGAFTHELKTPMTSIIGYADLLRTQKLGAKDEAEALDYIFSEAKRLENLSLKMLDLFVADKKELVLKRANPAQLVRHVAKHLQNAYDKYQVKIEVKAEDGICLLEPDLFQTLLINLLDNAKKSMEGGGTIRVTVEMRHAGCMVVVSDNGKGIPKEALKHLTEAFYRVDKARARSKGNAGLGLALCEKIVQLHHGSMHFESTEGVGTIVTVVLNGGNNEK